MENKRKEKVLQSAREREFKKALKNGCVKAVILIISIVLGAYTQLLILHPEINNVYIGTTFVVFLLCTFIYYNAIVNITRFLVL